MIQKPKCESHEMTNNTNSSDSHLHWKDHFQKNPLYFRIVADFGADSEIDNSNIGNKTTNIYEQNPVCNGCYIIPELNVY